MSNGWQKLYTELTDFISKYPEVEIGTSAVSIPENVRPAFYQLFDMVRTAFVEGKFPGLLNEGRLLSESYLKAEREVIKLLGLDEVSMLAGAHRFLHDPIDGFRRGLFGPLFDLLKGCIEIEIFEQRASQNIMASFWPLYQLGYEKWVVISLLKLLEADKSFHISIRDISSEEEKILMRGGLCKQEVSLPKASKLLSFEHGMYPIFTVPDFIVHSARVNRYIAFSSEIGEALLTASNASEKREWYHLDSKVALGPGLTLVYVADEPDEISLVADAEKICRPDLILECTEQKEWEGKGGLEKAKLRHDSLKPTLGTYIVSMESVAERAVQELVPQEVSKEPILEQEQEPAKEQESERQDLDIHILTAGLDESKLEPIINRLMNQKGKDR